MRVLKKCPRALPGHLVCLLCLRGPPRFLWYGGHLPGPGNRSLEPRGFSGALCWRPEEARPWLPGHRQSCHRRAGLAGLPGQGKADIQLSTQGKILLPPVTCGDHGKRVTRNPEWPHTQARVCPHAGPQTHKHVFIFVVSNLLN